MDLDDRKSRLRREMEEQRRARAARDPQGAAQAVAARVEATPEFVAAACIALYAALPDELPTRPLFDLAVDSGKSVLFPRVVEDRRLEFAEVADWEKLRPGRYGVLEPAPDAPRVGLPALVCVPGLAFDREGNRLGRGGGYYDRTLADESRRRAAVFGLAFELQVLNAVPGGAADQRVDAVVTERAIYRTPSAGNPR